MGGRRLSGTSGVSSARVGLKSRETRLGSFASIRSTSSVLSKSSGGAGIPLGRQVQNRQNVPFRYQSIDRNAPYFVDPRVLQVRRLASSTHNCSTRN